MARDAKRPLGWRTWRARAQVAHGHEAWDEKCWRTAAKAKGSLQRGTVFCAHVEDPLAWQRTGLYKYLVVAWDHRRDVYEAWEASGLHTRFFSEDEVSAGVALLEDVRQNEDMRSWWTDDDLPPLPPLEFCGGSVGSARWRSGPGRDTVFPPRVSGYKPYGTLELAGPLLFYLHSRRLKDEGFQNVVDIGAGHGRTAAWLTNAWGFQVRAFDVILPESPEFNVEIFDGRQLPLESKSVDCALFSFVLHHCRHFELQRALLQEAARVSRSWIAVCEDTPEEPIHWKGTRGHDHLGQFNSATDWMKMFNKIGLKLLRRGQLWQGPRKGPSPYFCARSFFILEVPADLCPLPATGPVGLSGCGCLPARGATPQQRELTDDERQGLLKAAMEDDPVGAEIIGDIRDRWLSCAQDGSETIFSTFSQLKLPSRVQRNLQLQGISRPSPVQRAAIPAALTGQDLVGVAATGSGKTLAYLLPLLLRILSAGTPTGAFGLVLLPTRELALQVAACAEALIGPGEQDGLGQTCSDGGGVDFEKQAGEELSRISIVSIWGGAPRWEQQHQLQHGRKWPECQLPGHAWVIAATPGRLLDLVCSEMDEGRHPLQSVRVLVLDEGDRMLEEGLGDQLDAVARRAAPLRQTLFFSATWCEDKVGKQAACFCRQIPVILRIGSGESAEDSLRQSALANRNIRQIVEVFDAEESEEEREERKLSRLLELLRLELVTSDKVDKGPDSESLQKALVFCTTKKFADGLVAKLSASGCPAVAVHGNKTQTERLQNLAAFASATLQAPRILVATDVLGRGIDLPNVTHVFVYDMPGCIEDYVHRIGRTARGLDGQGKSITFFEFTPCVPKLAEELAHHLADTAQHIPVELKRIVEEVASGSRAPGKKPRTSQGETNDQQTASFRADLATPEELGDWNAGGYRSWMIEMNALSARESKDTGWLVFGSAGVLHTDRGPGCWKLEEEHMLVNFGTLELRLTLRKTWNGRRHCNFLVEDNNLMAGVFSLSGWVQKTKNYKFQEPNRSAD